MLIGRSYYGSFAEIIGGPGAETISGLQQGTSGLGASYDVFFGGSGPDLIIAGIFPASIIAVTGNDTIIGSGTDHIWLGAGASSVQSLRLGTIIGSTGDATVSAVNALPNAKSVVFGGAGRMLFLSGAASSTVIGGGGQDVFAFLNGRAGGSAVIASFVPGQDFVALQGYAAGAAAAALATASVAGGTTTLALADGTQVSFLGIASLTSASCV